MPTRRRRRRSRPQRYLWAIVVLIIVSVLVGGVSKINAESGPYNQSVDSSYVKSALVVAATSNVTGTRLDALFANLASTKEKASEIELATLDLEAIKQAAASKQIHAPTTDQLATLFTSVMGDRRLAVTFFQKAVDGIFGVTPTSTQITAIKDKRAHTATTSATLSSVLPALKVISMLVEAGKLLTASNVDYKEFQKHVTHTIGTSLLPASSWFADPTAWTTTSVGTMITEMESSPTFAQVMRVVIVPNDVQITPKAVPQGSPNAQGTVTPNPGKQAPPKDTVRPTGAAIIPPSHVLTVTAVFANQGNENASHIEVSAVVTSTTKQGPPSETTHSGEISLQPGTSTAIRFPQFSVRPNVTYHVTVSLIPPSAQSNVSNTSESFSLYVAP